jgi:hypothetical protein
VAAAVASWCAAAATAQDGQAPVAGITAAEAWLKSATDTIRNGRLAPLASQARSIWAMLRQESNVDLGAIRLAGSSTQRRLELDVSVDGAPGSALGVMSQGEVNALALSVFLPRVRLPASPFRFLVIDDPVQAMDPAKVDGLARVLEKAATDRQAARLGRGGAAVAGPGVAGAGGRPRPGRGQGRSRGGRRPRRSRLVPDRG